MNVVGIDLSLTCTGVATADGARTIKPKCTGMERLAWVRRGVLAPTWYVFPRADLVVIEGYSMGTARQQSHAHALGELGGVVRLALWEFEVPFVDVAPASLKKYATGVGNAKKDAVLTAAVRRLGYQGDDHNEADSLWLRAMGMDAYGEPVVSVPESHRVALRAVKWPEIAGQERVGV